MPMPAMELQWSDAGDTKGAFVRLGTGLRGNMAGARSGCTQYGSSMTDTGQRMCQVVEKRIIDLAFVVGFPLFHDEAFQGNNHGFISSHRLLNTHSH